MVAAAAAKWRPEFDRWLELSESALRTSYRSSSGVRVAAAVAGVPLPDGLPTPAEHTFLLCTCCLTSAECNSHIRTDLASLQHKKSV